MDYPRKLENAGKLFSWGAVVFGSVGNTPAFYLKDQILTSLSAILCLTSLGKSLYIHEPPFPHL